jgi:hypothetical protein
MVCKSTSIKLRRRAQAAFTLVEFMLASGMAMLASAAIIALAVFTTRGFVAMTNYTDMALASRMALDKMSRSIRLMSSLTAYETNSITLRDAGGNSLSYTWDPTARTVVSVSGGQTNTYLTGCDSLNFWIYQHTLKSNTFDCYDPAYVTNARMVQLTWTCSRQLQAAKVNTELVESAKIALRNR